MKKLLFYSVVTFLFGICVMQGSAFAEEKKECATTFGDDLYGAPKESIDEAKTYLKDTFFYSTKEGDKYDGAVLSGRDLAQREVQTARKAYQEEVITAAFGQSMEALTTGAENALERAKGLLGKLKKAKSYDKKKAVEVVIMQNEIRERILRLSLELEILELDLVDMLVREPGQGRYIIARTVEQVEADQGQGGSDSSGNGRGY